MDRTREARRLNFSSAANGLSRRRQRTSSVRDSHGEDGQTESQETVKSRDRTQKRDRDRDRYRDRELSKIQTKRKRGDSSTGGGESGEGSAADEEEYDVDERRPAHVNSQNTSSFSSLSSNHNAKKPLPSTKPLKQALVAVKSTDETIGVRVPRKARSASVKRSHENRMSGNGGIWEDHKASTSADANSPSCSNASVKKKMKPNGPKTRIPKPSKASDSVQQDDIEIEIAEVLFGLKKQSQNSKGEKDVSVEKLESKDLKSMDQELEPIQKNSAVADPLPETRKNKFEADDCLNSSEKSMMAMTSPAELPTEKQTSSATESEMNKDSCVTSKVVDAAKGPVEPHEEDTNQCDMKASKQGSVCSDGPAQKSTISDEKESSLCTKTPDDFQDSTMTKAERTASENKGRKEERFKIDLMAPPPLAWPPDKDGFNEFTSDAGINKSVVKDGNVKESDVKETEEKKLSIREWHKMKFDLANPDKDNERETVIKSHNSSQQQSQPPSTMKVESSAQCSSAPLQFEVAGWANGLPQLGCMSPFQTIVQADGSSRSAAAQQPPPFVLSQPRPKKCTTHHYIAQNIFLNQQLTKTNQFWQAGASSASLLGAKANNLDIMSSTENPMQQNRLQGKLSIMNLKVGQDKGQMLANFAAPNQEDKSSESVTVTDPAQRKQPVPQQVLQPASTGSFLHAPAFIFPVNQQQVAITGGTINHSGPSKTAASSRSTSISGNSTATLPAGSTTVPPVPAAVSYGYPNVSATETPYMTVLHNNGYSYPVPASIGTAPTIRGTHPQALPFFNGSFYSSQFFHPSQIQQQQLQAYSRTNESSASSSSHKQPPQSQQPREMSVTGSNNMLSSANMQQQLSQKQHAPKQESEMTRDNTPSTGDTRILTSSHNKANVYGQNFPTLQPLNFALLPSSAVSGGSQGGKEQQSQQKSLKGGVEVVPPHAFAMSFSSFTGSNNTPSNLSFSSVPQNHAIFQSQGYQVASVAQAAAAQQKNHQVAEMKNGRGSSSHEDGKKAGYGKPATSNGQTLVFDNPARTLSFVSSPFAGNWPSHSQSISSCQIASNPQNQMQQHQKQHTLQQSRSKAQANNSQPSASVTCKLTSNGPIFPPNLVESSRAQWKNTRIPTSEVSPISIASSIASNLKSVSQQQVTSSPGQTQISFERNAKSGQQIPSSNQSPSPLAVGSPSNAGGNLRTSSTGSKAGSSIPALQLQQTENSSSASTGQKSSPVCGRNVPSILSTCAGQLSELKY